MNHAGVDHGQDEAPAGRTLPPAAPVRHAVWPAVLAVLAVAVALTIVVLGVIAHQYRVQVHAEARDRTVAIARVLEEHASRTLGIHAASLAHIEWMVDDLGWEGIARSPLLHERLKAMSAPATEVQSYWITDTTGMIRASSFEWPMRPLSAVDRDYFQFHTRGPRGIHIGTRLKGRILSDVFFTVSRRMEQPDGSFQGVAQLSLLPHYFADVYRSVLRAGDDVVMLLREDGHVLVREPLAGDPKAEDIGRFPALIAAAETDGVFHAVTPFDGVERLMARRKVPDLPVYVVYGTATASLEAAWRQRLLPYAYFAGPATLLLILLGLVALRRSRQAADAQFALHRANEALESRIAERTRHLDRALADKEVLLRDIHHRVKNNLQVILSLLELQAQRSPELRTSFDEALTRINTMGLIHEQIYRTTDVSAVRLDEFVGALSHHLRSFYQRPGRDVRITHAADPVSLDLQRVVPFALILNEVVSNAFKHAFADRMSGAIAITVADQDETIRLTIQDDGVGQGSIGQGGTTNGGDAKAGGKRSMGMDLVRAFTRQIQGEHRFTDEGGTRFDLTFPKHGPLA